MRKYGVAFLIIVLFFGLMAVPETSGLSNPKKNLRAHKKHAHAQTANLPVSRIPKQLVLGSASALVKDQETGRLFVQKKAETILPIASITKLMTAMVVLDARMNLEESVRIDQQDVDIIRHSHSRLPVGTFLNRREALLLALMSSENRAAHALARTYPGGIARFVVAMNYKARLLGLAETHFLDPTGISTGNVSSARDLARMMDTAYNYPLIRELTTCKEATITSGRRTLAFRNTNRLIRNSCWEIGLSKTGYIEESGRCLVMQATVAERPVLIVLLDSQGTATRFADANRIKKWMEDQIMAGRKRIG